MFKHTLVRRAVRHALLVNAAVLTCAAGQSALAADDQITEVVVTGSRIARPDIEASTPVQILSNDVIESTGSANVADILAQLPAVGTPGLSRTNSNFLTSSNGVSTVNLRNLQDQRTLVLINGRRVVAGVGGTSIVDINNIPTDLLENVQVLTGGASAVYGSEAVAGVVNFILKDDFEGLRFRGQGGASTEGDSDRRLGSLTAGYNFGDNRGNITANIQYDKDYGLRSRNRAISANDVPTRSSFVPQGRFDLRGAGGSNWTYNASNQLQQGFASAVDGYNRNNDRYIATPLERTLVTALGHWDFTDSLRLFAEGSYSKMKSNSSLEPLATNNSDAVDENGNILAGLSIDNPFIPQPIRDQMTALVVDTLPFVKRMNNVFDRSNRNDRDFYRGVLGLQGQLGNDWKWDAYYERSQTKEATASETALRDRYFHALDAIAGPGGTPICRDAAARAAGCVPFNPFGFNSVSADAANYITAGGIKDTYDAKVQQDVVGVNFTGPVFELPAGSLMIAAGAEYRKEQSDEAYSPETQAGNTMGNALSNTHGEYNVKEAYVETVVPILRDVPGAQSLEFEAAFRFGDYSTVGNVNSWKTGLTWAPIADIRFRAVYSQATRAPNIGELFAGANQTFESVIDPCETQALDATPVGAYCRSIPGIAQIIATSPTHTFEYQLSDLQSEEGRNFSNPNLQEETAKTWTVGMVLTPQSFRNFTASIDYFQIKVDNAIQLLQRQYALDTCVNSLGASPFCSLITRENVNTPRPRTPGTVFTIDVLQLNAASIETSGVDLAAGYVVDFPHDQRLNLTLAYTYLDKLDLQTAADLPAQHELGQLDGPGRLGAGFRHRANLGLNYSWDRLTATWRVNYLSSIKDTLEANSPGLDPEQNNIPSYTYHDMQARYAFGGDRQYTVYAGMDNVFDKKPPIIGQNGASNITGTETAADTYDPFGRMWYAGVEASF